MRFESFVVVIYFPRPLIAAGATSLFTLLFVFIGVHEIANAKSVLATKEAKRPSCCDHLSARKAYAGPGATAGLCARF